MAPTVSNMYYAQGPFVPAFLSTSPPLLPPPPHPQTQLRLFALRPCFSPFLLGRGQFDHTESGSSFFPSLRSVSDLRSPCAFLSQKVPSRNLSFKYRGNPPPTTFCRLRCLLCCSLKLLHFPPRLHWSNAHPMFHFPRFTFTLRPA